MDKTLLVQAGRPERCEGRHVNLPIELGSTMVFDTLNAFDHAREHRYENGTLYYGRYGNIASFELERVFCSLENATDVSLASSGVAAISFTLSSILESGSHLLVADNVYGNTRSFCDGVLQKRNIEIQYYDPMIGESIETLIKSNTAAIMFEAPGSGTFEFPDIQGIAAAARAAGVITVLDGTWATPIFCQPLSLGVDVLVYSASKYVGGHSDCMMGVVATKNSRLNQIIRKEITAYGDKLGSQEVFLALRGLRTLNMRMQAIESAGLGMAHWFLEQPQVQRVLHPGLKDCPGHEFWRRDCTGSAGLFSVIFHPCKDNYLSTFIDSLHHFGIGVSWGGYESLVLPVAPVRTAVPWQEPGQLVRFNIGFENIDELKADLSAALPLLKTQ